MKEEEGSVSRLFAALSLERTNIYSNGWAGNSNASSAHNSNSQLADRRSQIVLPHLTWLGKHKAIQPFCLQTSPLIARRADVLTFSHFRVGKRVRDASNYISRAIHQSRDGNFPFAPTHRRRRPVRASPLIQELCLAEMEGFKFNEFKARPSFPKRTPLYKHKIRFGSDQAADIGQLVCQYLRSPCVAFDAPCSGTTTLEPL